MRAGYSAEQVRRAEAPHLAAGEPLMLRAASALAEEIRSVLAARGEARAADREAAAARGAGRVLVLAGSGNNGGDALYAGAELARAGVDVSVLAVGSRIHDEGLAAALEAGAVRAPEPAPAADREERARHWARLAREHDVVVDGILGTGTGARPALRDRAREVVAEMLPVVREEGGPAVVAVDIPSGISPDDGSVPDPTVLPATVTVTFGGYKAGLLLPPASSLAGRVRLVDLGLGLELARMTPLVSLPDD